MSFSFKAARFHTKVLLPVVGVMVLLVVLAMVVVNYRIKAQLQQQSARALEAADANLKSFQKVRTRLLRLRFTTTVNEPKYRAACQTKDRKTLEPLLRELLGDELGGDFIQYKPSDSADVITAKPDLDGFGNASRASVKEALEGFGNADTIRVGEKLFDIVSVPVRVPGGDDVMGALTFCMRLGDAEAQEIGQLSGIGLVLLAGDKVAGASRQRADLFRQCVTLFADLRASPEGGLLREIDVPREHFQARVGRFDSKSGDPSVGYVLLYSVEDALADLRRTQRIIVTVSIVAIILGTLCIWYLVGNVTRPLRDLRNSAEAVGRGDFSRRVAITSNDECGELARVFNRMTENLQTSRGQLEEAVTTLKTTQAQLIQREKLSAIGEFVAGVTHELNNPLTSVLGFSELLQQTAVDERQRRFIDRIAHGARRCQKIVQSLLGFARQHQPERKPVDLNAVVEATIEIMAYEMRTSNIELVSELDRSLPAVLADSHQLQQVFLNLVNNARQAMEAHQPSGILRIRTETGHGRVRVIFSDNGPGISPENLKKIFDPFFTTKEAGKGTGLGLSLSYGIVQEHGGTIVASSVVGQGATFTISLPAHAASPRPTAFAGDDSGGAVPNGGGRRVLVVDDEEGIRDLISETLTADGYQVDCAPEGEAALRCLRTSEYNIILCDWKMPGLNGQQLYARVAREHRDASQRFVFMTGDVINVRMEAFLKEEGRLCLPKPFSLDDFRRAVAELADTDELVPA